jgi:hypothetical protein
MTNVNSAADLAKYAEENDIDLTGYGESLAELVASGKLIDPEQPFAEHVLEHLRNGGAISDAVAAARERTLENVKEHDAE